MMLRDAVEENPGLRWHRAGRPRPLHLGRHAARVLREHAHRSSISSGSLLLEHVEKSAAQTVRRRADIRLWPIAAIWRSRFFPSCADEFQRAAALDRQLHRSAGGAAVREFGGCGGAGASGHQLPRSLYSHQDPPAVCSLAAGSDLQRTCKSRSRRRSTNYREEYAEYYKSFAHAGFARDARCRARRWC